MIRQIRKYTWRDGKSLIVGRKTLVMGILNITPDSFSDGGSWAERDKALRHMEEMVAAGADIIDIGAESTRPGYTMISAEEEIGRLEKILPALVAQCPVPVSVDTYKAATADYAMTAGAHIMNDIWGLQYASEPGRMAAVAAKHQVPVIVMHNQNGTAYGNIFEEMKAFFTAAASIAAAAGVAEKNIIIDPGIGFGKDFSQNMEVIRHLGRLTELPYPLLLGVSRKGFIGKVLDLPVTERMEGTAAVTVLGIVAGASVMRVHDVKEIVRICRMTDALLAD